MADGDGLRRSMFGPKGAEEQVAATSDDMAPMQDIVTRICFGAGWQRGVIDLKTRSLMTQAMLTAPGRSHAVRIHTRGAVANGATRDEICGVILHGPALLRHPGDDRRAARLRAGAGRDGDGMSVRVGFVGHGNMGVPMCRNLVAKGFPPLVHDARPGRAAEGLAASMPPGGGILADMSSADPMGSRRITERLAARGIGFVDAPVSGAVPRAEAGTLIIMLGADDPEAATRAGPVLPAMGERIFETGGIGTGHAMKALNNVVAAAGFAAASETLILGERFGLDPATAIAIMSVSTGRNFPTESTIPAQVFSGAFASVFALALLAKDVGIAGALAEGMGADLPVLTATRDWWAGAAAGPEGGGDHSRACRDRKARA